MSGKTVKNKSRSGNTGCCVVLCHNTYSNTDLNIKFYSFPSKPHLLERRQKWIKAVNRINPDGTPWQPTNNSRICSHHFIGENKSEDPRHPAYLPTIFPTNYKRKESSTIPLDRFNRWKKRKLVSEISSSINNEQELDNNSYEGVQLAIHIKEMVNKSNQVVSFQHISNDFIYSCDFDRESNNVSTQATISSTKNLKTDIVTKDKSIGPDIPILLSGFRGYNSIKNDKELLAVTGVRLEVFKLFLDMLPPIKFQKINIENRLLIFLIKTKTGLSFDCIATFFDVDPTCISRIFYDVLSILAQKTRNFIFWPSKEDIQETMPPSFKIHYSNCRVIIDCTEIKCEQPSLVLIRNHMYSDYKSGYTVKFLLGITPSGMISFKSECYGGRSSDPFITNDSNFLKLLEPGDEVMADKGFPGIKKSLDVPNAIIVTPPFLHDGHLTEDEIENTYNIASVRIHVERCIARIKMYNILDKINIDLLPYIDDIVHICCVLVNLQKPIFKSDDKKKNYFKKFIFLCNYTTIELNYKMILL